MTEGRFVRLKTYTSSNHSVADGLQVSEYVLLLMNTSLSRDNGWSVCLFNHAQIKENLESTFF